MEKMYQIITSRFHKFFSSLSHLCWFQDFHHRQVAEKSNAVTDLRLKFGSLIYDSRQYPALTAPTLKLSLARIQMGLLCSIVILEGSMRRCHIHDYGKEGLSPIQGKCRKILRG